jgi:hypothetical protein
MMGKHRLPSGTITFELEGGPSFALDIITAMRKLNEITGACAAADTGNWEHLDQLAGWIKDTTGEDLTPGQSLSLFQGIQDAYEVFTHRRDANGRSAPTSRSSMPSTPAD